MPIRCKFRLDSVTRTAAYGASLEFNAVMGSSEENKKFFKYTPNGQLNVHTVNEEAIAELKLGGEYYLDITPA